jgi:tetratricopeptide (TPR) repeat protein/DNA-binding CsgD family transcriptional regulator
LKSNFQNNETIVITQNDTIQKINTYIKQIQNYSGKGEYFKSYELVWKALPLVVNDKFSIQKVEILNRLITLYMMYQQYEKAHETYQQAILITNERIEGKENTKLLGRLYSSGAWIQMEHFKNLDKAEELVIKSIEAYNSLHDKNHTSHYFTIHLANIYIKKKQFAKAKNLLQELDKLYPLPLQPIHGLLYERMGLYYVQIKDNDSAIYYYKKSIEAVDKFDSHADKKLKTLKNLSNIFISEKRYKEAYSNLNKAFDLNEALFSSNKSQNKALFEINNKYETELKQNQHELNTQKLKILENENEFFKTKIILIITCLAILFGFIIFYFNRKNKLKIIRKDLINKNQQLELKKQEEVLELKNKELLSSAAQLLEKDTLQKDIKTQLNNLNVSGENIAIVKEIRNSLKINTSNKWNEFESHFTSVNQDFYSSLKTKFPLLTPTDLKMCAFIKLGFSSKDMSQIMGLSVEGINTSRSRLRKKMGLERKTVLTEFLQQHNTFM